LWETEGSLPIQLTGSLPPDAELQQLYEHWKNLYEALASVCTSHTRSNNLDRTIVFEEGEVLQFSRSEFFNVCEQLTNRFNNWLNSQSFNRIEYHLRTHLNYNDSIRLIVETDDETLRCFPWQLWHFFEDYPHAEMALSYQEYQQIKSLSKKSTTQIRILAILGNSEGIDVQQDRVLLEQLPFSEVIFLVEPKRKELDRWLWDEQGWDILFFAGHSSTENSGKIGYLEINAAEKISLDQLKNALKQAISRGLRLAIFNSCGGLGLAQQLAYLSIPQIIVMRQPVPDLVAQEFFKHFLRAFKSGKSFYAAVREARERLQALEDECPCASWLPVICQNPAVEPFSWPQFATTNQISRKTELYPFIISIFVSILVVGLRMLGFGLDWEINIFNWLLRMRPYEGQDPRILIVIATPEDIKAQSIQPTGKASLSDHTLAQLLDKLQQQYQPTTIGIDIYRDFPAETHKSELGTSLRQNNIFGICKVRSLLDGDKDGIAPSPEISEQQIGFADFVADHDRVVRRHLLAMSRSSDATDPCVAVNSFSLLIALHYLEKAKKIGFNYTSTGEIKVGEIVFKELDTYFGSSQVLDTRGRQILLNYRSLNSPDEIATTIELRDIIEDKIPSSQLTQLKGRIVLIGIADSLSVSADYWPTPFSTNQSMDKKEIPGIFIQAHMISQLISAVLDQRPLLWFMPWWVDFFWILTGCLIAILLDKIGILRLEFIAVIILCVNFALAYLLFIQGVIIPLFPLIIALLLYTSIQRFNTKLIKQ